MKNKVLTGLGFNDEVRFFIIDSRELVNELADINQTTPVCSAAIGRSATITAIMGLMLKDQQNVTTILDGQGPAGQIITIADATGKVRATMNNPHVDIPLKANGKLDVSGAVGTNGMLKVIKDLKMKEPFVGSSPIISGEVAEDYTYYFSVSEQLPTAISAGVLVDVDHSIKSAGALIIQLLPNTSEATIDKLENVFKSLKPMTTMLLEMNLEEILNTTFADDYRILSEQNVYYECTCNEDKFLEGLRLLAKDEITDLKTEEEIECVCNFCHTKYQIKTNQI